MLNDFLLNESIVPIKTQFGTNSDRNNNSFNYFDDFVVTFFKANNIYYVVGLDIVTGDVGFGVSNEDTIDPNEYDDSKFITSNPISVFGKVFYVLSEIIKETNTNTIQFDSANFSLGKIYDKLVKNKFFIQSLMELGFEYNGKIKDKYVFTKIKN
jgi:hypothetical protein